MGDFWNTEKISLMLACGTRSRQSSQCASALLLTGAPADVVRQGEDAEQQFATRIGARLVENSLLLSADRRDRNVQM